ncbi:hypothetical protein M501DRAFT_991286 [Patellaria atrata CBS 101060]|uniref:Protein PNS1 n=1 Tax=Patellaria atrata CBS 101060 TaxID=1346257 RepID=A0A9P4SES0_9PEZI|nr:hypothetical protein M501DRAFT_991286 [Patellaria atrata CBS 101060]
MFSEYASRFLAQSQSRLSLNQAEHDSSNRNPSDRHRGRPGHQRYPSSRSYLQRSMMPNPYQNVGASQISRFPFASRISTAQAPLFYSATDQFREEDDEEEHEREAADYYALRKSRKDFGDSHMTESSEMEDNMPSIERSGEAEDAENDASGFGMGRGIRSSWRGGRIGTRGRPEAVETVEEREERDPSVATSEMSAPSSKGKGKLVDVELASTIHENIDLERGDGVGDFDDYLDDDQPPAFQQFRRPLSKSPKSPLLAHIMPQETDPEIVRENRAISEDRDSVPPIVASNAPDPPRHDTFWSTVFAICLASLFATWFLVYLHTSTPTKKKPLPDTIYSTLHASFHLLAAYTLVSIVVALLWFAVLRNYARRLILIMLIAVPIISFSFSLYPLISSYKGRWHGNSFQDKVMRWLSFFPSIFAVIWVYTVYRGRYALGTAIEILEFSCRILAANSPLVLVGGGTLTTVVLWTWTWMGMFSRVFLQGHWTKKNFIIDSTTWWLGVFFILVYLWSLAVISGIQRATTAATVSQWYFHRNTLPQPSSRVIVQASLGHATSTMFGTICLSTFLSLAIRLPLLVLPRRLAGFLTVLAYSLVPSPIATLTNPLTLTNAAIFSQDLGTAARQLSHMSFVSKTSPTTTLSPRSFSKNSVSGSTLVPYRLAKLLLHATRFITSLALGYGGWVSTARSLEVVGSGLRGSLYAYVVGLCAAAIGWGILGAMEGVLGGIVDALVVCWGSEVGARALGEVRYCREAGELFGERGVY